MNIKQNQYLTHFYLNKLCFNKFYKHEIRRLWNSITNYVTRFLFYNRNAKDILEHIDNFVEIVEKDKPSELSTEKKKIYICKFNLNLYICKYIYEN